MEINYFCYFYEWFIKFFLKTTLAWGTYIPCREGLYKDTRNEHRERPDSVKQFMDHTK